MNNHQLQIVYGFSAVALSLALAASVMVVSNEFSPEEADIQLLSSEGGNSQANAGATGNEEGDEASADEPVLVPIRQRSPLQPAVFIELVQPGGTDGGARLTV